MFTSEKPLSARDLRNILPEEPTESIKEALKELQKDYDDMERSIALKEVAQGFQLRTRSEYAPYILQMLKVSPTKLSNAAMETLAIIAYKQPILRQEIERLRGVDVGGIVRTLMEKGLIKIMGRKELPGRPLIYGTTKKFLEIFDLKNISSLPKLKEVKDLGTEEQGTEMPSREVLLDETSGEQEGPEEPDDSKSDKEPEGSENQEEPEGSD